MVAMVAPSGANAQVSIGASPAPRARFAGAAPQGGPKIGTQGRMMNPRRSRAIRPRLHQDNREVPTRDRLGPSPGPKSVVSPRMGCLPDSKKPGQRSGMWMSDHETIRGRPDAPPAGRADRTPVGARAGSPPARPRLTPSTIVDLPGSAPR